MHYYTTYGLTVRSDVGLPELTPVSGESLNVDVDIRRDSIEPVSEEVEQNGRLRIQARPDLCQLTYESIGSFIVESGSTIRYDVESRAIREKKIFRRVIEKELLALLLHQRGLLVLHASAVAVNGKAAVFVGDRGTGKSTTAAAFFNDGYPILEDDVVAIRFDDGRPVVVPGIAQLRLSPEAVDEFSIRGTERPDDDWGPKKQYKRLSRTSEPVPLGEIYILQWGEKTRIRDIPAPNRFFVLVSSTYAQGLVSDTGSVSAHFEQCSDVLSAVPVNRLQRPKRFEKCRDVISLITDRLC